MAADQGLIDWVAEAMEPVGPVTKRAMMGGATGSIASATQSISP